MSVAVGGIDRAGCVGSVGWVSVPVLAVRVAWLGWFGSVGSVGSVCCVGRAGCRWWHLDASKVRQLEGLAANVSCGVRAHAQLPAVDLKSTPLATRAN